MSAVGLYLHVPFCAAICNYCNFNRGLFDPALKARYVDALIADLRRSTGPLRADSIYFGGGTPSLLDPDDVRRLVGACRSAFSVTAGAEVTLEANPESVDEARLAAYRDAGVNRVSFGVQSLRGDELRRLSRLHSAERACGALAEARAAGFENVSLDLMMWLPGQQVAHWLESVEGAIALDPEHVSLYLLEVYPNAPLREEMARARWSQAPDADAAEMYMEALARLEAAGYQQYEISNVAKPGRASRHNLKYWSDGEWLGFGCGAHSTRNGVRWKNVAAAAEYIELVSRDEPAGIEHRRLALEERLGDALFTGLRLAQGLDLEAIGVRYGVDVWSRYGRELAPFLDEGLLVKHGPRLWLTRRGMLLAHEVMAVFV